MKKRYSVEEMVQYKQLKRRESQLVNWREELKEKMQTLIKKQEHQVAELAELEKTIATKFKELEDAGSLFNLSEVSEQSLSLEDRNYVTNEKKEIIIKSLMDKYKRGNPGAKSIPFKILHKMLEEGYQVETRSLTNFFKNQLPEYELVGGTRNKSIVLKAGGKK